MIYERLPDETDCYSCHGIGHGVYFNTCYIFKTISASTAILTTCRAVHSEASSIIKKNALSALTKPARIIILEYPKEWWCPWRCPRRMFGELLLVIYWRWHLLSYKEFSMSTRDVSWKEPRHCIEEHFEHHMWNITEGPAKNMSDVVGPRRRCERGRRLLY
jgi:hypothetical protein